MDSYIRLLCPLFAFTQFLEGIFDRKNLKLTNRWEKQKQHVENVEYGIGFNHLFPREPDKTIDIDVHYNTAKSKVDYLAQKFLDLKNYRTLYVWRKTQHASPALLQAITNFKESLRVLRGNDNFSLLIVEEKSHLERKDQPGLYFETVLPSADRTGDTKS